MFQIDIYMYIQIHTHMLGYNVFLTVGHTKKMEIHFSRSFTLGPAQPSLKQNNTMKYKIAPSHKNLGNFSLNIHFFKSLQPKMLFLA